MGKVRRSSTRHPPGPRVYPAVVFMRGLRLGSRAECVNSRWLLELACKHAGVSEIGTQARGAGEHVRAVPWHCFTKIRELWGDG